MPSPAFRIGYAASPADPWTWGAYDASASVPRGAYCKVELQSTAGVDSIWVTLPSADPATLAAGLPAVTVDQGTKTAVFQAPNAFGRSVLVQVVINNGVADGSTEPTYARGLEINVLTESGLAVLAVGETDQYDRTSGWLPKVNDLITSATTGGTLDPTIIRTGVNDDTELGIAFFDAPDYRVKQSASGSCGGNAALYSLCNALGNYGLVADSTTLGVAPITDWVELTRNTDYVNTAPAAGTITMSTNQMGSISVGDPIRVFDAAGGYVDGGAFRWALAVTGLTGIAFYFTNVDANGRIWLQCVNLGSGNYRVDIYSSAACDAAHLIGHTLTLSSTGSSSPGITPDNGSGLGGTITLGWGGSVVYGVTSVCYYKWFTVASISTTSMTLYGPALSTSAAAIQRVWHGARSKVGQVSLLVPGPFALTDGDQLLDNIANSYVPWDGAHAHVTRVRVRTKAAGAMSHPSINVVAGTDNVLSTALTLTFAGTWYSSVNGVLPAGAHLAPETALELTTTQGDTSGTVDSDLSVSITVVLE